MSLILIIKLLRLIVVLPIALVVIVLLPFLELCYWCAEQSTWRPAKTWSQCARDIIAKIAKFVWP